MRFLNNFCIGQRVLTITLLLRLTNIIINIIINNIYNY